MVRYQDSCQKPAGTVMGLLEFLRAPKWMSGRLSKPFAIVVISVDGVGLAAKVVELGRGAQADLKRFGYESDDRDAWLAAARNMQQLGISDYLNFESNHQMFFETSDARDQQ